MKLLKGSAERLTRNHIKICIPETTKALKAINFLTMSFAPVLDCWGHELCWTLSVSCSFCLKKEEKEKRGLCRKQLCHGRFQGMEWTGKWNVEYWTETKGECKNVLVFFSAFSSTLKKTTNTWLNSALFWTSPWSSSKCCQHKKMELRVTACFLLLVFWHRLWVFYFF